MRGFYFFIVHVVSRQVIAVGHSSYHEKRFFMFVDGPVSSPALVI